MKHRTGHLYQRGNIYWLQYRFTDPNQIDPKTGKKKVITICQSLETSDLEKAQEKQKEIMRPLLATSRVDALTLVQKKLADAKDEAQTANESAHPPLAIADAWATYDRATNRPDSGEATLSGYESAWKRFSAWVTKKHPNKTFMRDIDAGTASDYAKKLTVDKVTASTFNQHIGLLRLVWRCLAEQIRAADNPWLTISKKRPQRLAHRRHSITPEQFENLLTAGGDADYHDLLYVLGFTGQRLVDGVMLRWDAVDFKRKVITLSPRKTARTGKTVYIPLLPALADMLQKRRDMVAGNVVFPELAEAYKRDSATVSKRIQAIFTRAGMTPKETRAGVKRAVVVYGAHSLRHYFATQALSAGIPGEIVKRITGHSSDAMLEGYEHVDAAMISGLAAKLSNGKQPAALPAHGADIPRAQVRALGEKLNGKTWGKVKKELMEIAK